MPYKNPEDKKAWFQRNKTRMEEKSRIWKRTHKSSINKSNNKSRKKLRLKVLIHYSGTDPPQCVNPFNLHLPNDPFLTDLRVLSIDHINGGGRKDRREGKSGSLFYYWLQRNNFPKGFQVLCMNCQYVKRELNKEHN